MSETIEAIVAEYFPDHGNGNSFSYVSLTPVELRAALTRAAEGRWVKVSERLPEPGKTVLALVGKSVIRCRRIPKFFAQCGENGYGDYEDEGGDYNEETDSCYWKEGWYEWNQFEETHWMTGETPTKWRSLPTPPTD